VGTSEIMGRVILLESKELAPGNETFAQVKLDRPVVTLRKDRFILRSYSPQATIGGGVVLHAYPARRSRTQPGVIEDLIVLDSSDDEAIVEHMLRISPPSLTRTELMRFTNVPGEELDQRLEVLRKEGKAAVTRDRIVHAQRLEEWKEKVRERLKAESEGRIYISKGEFIQSLPISKNQALAELILTQLEREGIIEVKAERIKLSARLDDMGDWKRRIEAVYRESEYQPPGLEELKSRVGGEVSWVNDFLSTLVDDGLLVRVAPGMCFHKEVVDRSVQILADYLKSHPGITVSEFRKLLGTSRKYALPLLQHFDSTGITVRDGDIRRMGPRLHPTA
jgi:selenocysteine-specific elongation factor